MLTSKESLLLFLLLFYFQLTHSATTPPIPIVPDPTYLTGIFSSFSNPLQNSNTFTVPYSWTMPTTSLNASLAVASTSF
jgi:hypothetical protein